jgi:putative chitinase
MRVTLQALIAAGIAPTQARLFADPLAAACERFGINTPPRVAGFVAQCRVESAGFTALEENLYYSSPERIRRIFPSTVPDLEVAARIARNARALANRVYGNRLGNGPESSGDGWRFRGRGLKQLTGRYNYTQAALALSEPYVESPDLVAQPIGACLTAAWFWSKHGLNTFADSSQWDAITRVVNGPGMLQAAERRQFSDQAVTVFA